MTWHSLWSCRLQVRWQPLIPMLFWPKTPSLETMACCTSCSRVKSLSAFVVKRIVLASKCLRFFALRAVRSLQLQTKKQWQFSVPDWRSSGRNSDGYLDMQLLQALDHCRFLLRLLVVILIHGVDWKLRNGCWQFPLPRPQPEAARNGWKVSASNLPEMMPALIMVAWRKHGSRRWDMPCGAAKLSLTWHLQEVFLNLTAPRTCSCTLSMFLRNLCTDGLAVSWHMPCTSSACWIVRSAHGLFVGSCASPRPKQPCLHCWKRQRAHGAVMGATAAELRRFLDQFCCPTWILGHIQHYSTISMINNDQLWICWVIICLFLLSTYKYHQIPMNTDTYYTYNRLYKFTVLR